MSANIVLWCCFIAIVISIICNFKWGVNMGLMAMSFAFIIGCLLNGDSVSTVFGYWPDSLIFFLLSSALFYGFATENGTVLTFGKKLMWLFRGNLMLIPWALFVVASIMAFLGAGMATMFFLTPIAFAMGVQLGMQPMLMSCAVNFGYVCGTYNPWTGNGVQLVNLIADNNVDIVEALRMGTQVYGTTLIRNVIFMAIAYVIYGIILRDKGQKEHLKNVQEVMEKPEPFTAIQKKTFVLIVASFLLILIPGIMNTMFDIDSPVFKNIAGFCQPQSLMVIFALVASLMNLADTKAVIKKLPMNTILLIAGVGFLMRIASSVGLNEMVVSVFENSNFSHFAVAGIVAAIAGFISLFSSTWSVVMPMMYPLVPAMAAATGVAPLTLYTAVIMGSSSTTLCPFSTAGAQQIALAPAEIQEKMVPGLLGVAIGTYVLNVVFCFLGLCAIFS